MFRQKVQKIYLIGCILIFALATIIAALSKFPNKAIFLIFVNYNPPNLKNMTKFSIKKEK